MTFSWQKALGGEAAHGMLVLSPRAVERLESYKPAWPLPKIFRLTKGGKINEGVFAGETLNTPSMLCVEDYLDTLQWAKSVGGLKALTARADANAKVLADWVARTPWIANLAEESGGRARTRRCACGLPIRLWPVCRRKHSSLSSKAWRRCWTRKAWLTTSPITATRRRPCASGAAARSRRADVEALTPWLDWAFAEAKAALPKAA